MDRQTNRQTHIYKSVEPATDQLEVEIKEILKIMKNQKYSLGIIKNRKIMKFQKKSEKL